jgi:hypothetical protein
MAAAPAKRRHSGEGRQLLSSKRRHLLSSDTEDEGGGSGGGGGDDGIGDGAGGGAGGSGGGGDDGIGDGAGGGGGSGAGAGLTAEALRQQLVVLEDNARNNQTAPQRTALDAAELCLRVAEATLGATAWTNQRVESTSSSLNVSKQTCNISLYAYLSICMYLSLYLSLCVCVCTMVNLTPTNRPLQSEILLIALRNIISSMIGLTISLLGVSASLNFHASQTWNTFSTRNTI